MRMLVCGHTVSCTGERRFECVWRERYLEMRCDNALVFIWKTKYLCFFFIPMLSAAYVSMSVRVHMLGGHDSASCVVKEC